MQKVLTRSKTYNFPIYWTDKQKVDFLQRVVLIHSYLYYFLDNPIWQDAKFDKVCKELVEIQNKIGLKYVREKTQYGYVFYDFDGNTGYDLYYRLTVEDKSRIKNISLSVLMLYRR